MDKKFEIWLNASEACYLMPNGEDAVKKTFLTSLLQ